MNALFRKMSLLLVACVLMLWQTSCMHDSLDNCGVYLDFVYNYNMGYTDVFDPYVNTVDVFVFDQEEKFRFTLHSERHQLIDNKRMFLGHDLPFGVYKILAVGGLSADFTFSDRHGNPLQQGITTIDEVQLALNYNSDEISHEFSSVWFGYPITVEYDADLSVWPLYFIKNTNHFNLVLVQAENTRNDTRNDEMLYTFEIVAPEGAVYSWINSPINIKTVTYKPYEQLAEEEPGRLWEAHTHTCRLFYREDLNYKMYIKNAQTQQVLLEHDLISLLSVTKPENRPDGTELPLQEYLDRQSEWNLIVLYSEIAGGSSGFTALKIWINDWLVWQHNMEV